MKNEFIFKHPPFPNGIVKCRLIIPRYKCSVDFLSSDDAILLHISLRHEANEIVLNDFTRGSWGEEVVTKNQKIVIGAPIEVSISVSGGRNVEVRVGELEPICVLWRVGLDSVSSLAVTVPVEVDVARLENESQKVATIDAPTLVVPASAVGPLSIGPEARFEPTLIAAVVSRLSEVSSLLLNLGLGVVEAPSNSDAAAPVKNEGETDSAQGNFGAPPPPPRRTIDEIGQPRVVFQDDVAKSWSPWVAHQSVKRHANGCFELQQDKSTPGLRRDLVDVHGNCFYEFSIEGEFPTNATKVYISVYDPDNHIDLLPHRLIWKNQPVHSAVFMTTSRTKRVQMRLLSERPVIGEKGALRSAQLKLLGPAESWVVDAKAWPRISASMASVKGRDDMVIDAVLSLYPFVDEVRVYLNGYEAVPQALLLPKVKTLLSSQWGDDGDAGKFFWAGDDDCDLCLICDDDLIFPANYVPNMVGALKRYNNKAIVGVHGILLKQPTPSYYDGAYRTVCRYVHGNPKDFFVHVLGTGAIIYDRRELKLTRHDFQYRNMADIWLLQQSLDQGIPMIALARDRNWIIQNQVVGGVPTIYDSSARRNNDNFDTSKVQTAIVRQLWPVTIPPSQASISVQRPKLAFGVIAGADSRRLEACLTAFDRNASPDAIWSVVVGIPAKFRAPVHKMLTQTSIRRELFFVDLIEEGAAASVNAMLSLMTSIKAQSAVIVADHVTPCNGWETIFTEIEPQASTSARDVAHLETLPPILSFPSLVAAAGQTKLLAQTPGASEAGKFLGAETSAFDARILAAPVLRSDMEPSRTRRARAAKTANKMFDRVFVLNLDRRPDRLAAIGAQLDNLDISFERFRAIDGRDEPLLSQWREYAQTPLAQTPDGVQPIKRAHEFYCGDVSRLARTAFIEQKTGTKAIKTPGAWSYMRNYIAILEHALEKEYESILVLDDDARFHHDFRRLFASMSEQVPEDWKIFQLGALQYDWGDDWITWRGRQLYNCNGSSVGSHATGIHWTAYAALLHQAQFMDLAFDIGALCHVKRIFAQQCFTCYPNLVIQDTSESDIASSEVQQSVGLSPNNIYRWRLPDYREFGFIS